VFPTVNAATTLFNPKLNSSVFGLVNGYELPVGLRFHAVLTAFKDNKWYYAEQKNLSVAPGMQFQLVPIASSSAEILQKLKDL
jgi:hypothetical protein